MDDHIRQRIEQFQFPEAWDDPTLHDLIRSLSLEEKKEAHDYIVEVERFRIASQPITISELHFDQVIRPNLLSPAEERAAILNLSDEEKTALIREAKELEDRIAGRNITDLGKFRKNKEKE